jgi:signal peptidase II
VPRLQATGRDGPLNADAAPRERTAEHVGHPLVRTVGLVVAAVVVVVDQATKQLALEHLEPGRFVPWLSDAIGWQLVFNPGGAFGVGAPHWIFLIVTVIVVVVVARSLPRCHTITIATAYGLLLAGAIGNVIDRLFRPGGPDRPAFGGGEVVDFVAWGTFPRFNVADSAITVGFLLLVLGLLLEERIALRAERVGGDRAERAGGDLADEAGRTADDPSDDG